MLEPELAEEGNVVECPGCGLMLPSKNSAQHSRYHASGECHELFNQFMACTRTLYDKDFIHQIAVDTYGAQHAGGATKSITSAFGLIGLCLALEHNYTGREVQKVHMKIPKQNWEKLELSGISGNFTVSEVLKAESGQELKILIYKWASSVWQSWSHHHKKIREITSEILYCSRK